MKLVVKTYMRVSETVQLLKAFAIHYTHTKKKYGKSGFQKVLEITLRI